MFDILALLNQGHGATLNFSPFAAVQTFRSHNSTLVQARKLILSMYVLSDNKLQILYVTLE